MSALTTDFYATLDPETRSVVQQCTGEIHTLVRRTALDIIKIGTKLLEVKKRLPHGTFGRWLEAEFEWTPETARRFINVARTFSQNPQIVEFAPSALYLLAESSIPKSAREEALERAAQGEAISHQVAKQIVAAHKPPPARNFAPIKPASELAAAPPPVRDFPPIKHESELSASPEETTDAEEQPPTNGQRHPALFTSSSDEWYTPPHLCDAVRRAFGDLPDLDPCTAEGAVMDAKRKFTIAQDGLSQIWRAGTLFLNPPFSNVDAWVERLVTAYGAGVQEAIALLPARTDTAWMRRLAPFPRCFLHGRVKYLSPTGESASAPFPSVVVYMGRNLMAFADAFASLGDIYVRWQHGDA